MTQFESVAIDKDGARDVLVVDVKIRRVKEIYRGVKSALDWNLPGMLVQDLVTCKE